MDNNILGIIVICIMSFLAWREKALNLSGAIAAFFVGIAIFIGTSMKGFILLAVFFVTSSFFSKWKRERKHAVEQVVAKGDDRDWAQVLANGGVPAICSLFFYWTGDSIWMIAYAVSLACSTADTWASEIGVLSKRDPFLLFPFKRVRKGTSGAFSLLGTVAGFIGAGFIAVTAKLLWFNVLTLNAVLWIVLFGFLGMVIDSFLGRSIQVKFRCSNCHIITEKTFHCGQPTNYYTGIRFINNDIVNVLSILISTSLVVFFYQAKIFG